MRKKAASKANPRVLRRGGGGVDSAALYVRVHALWVETRAIAQREDELCTILHELKQGEATEAIREELQALVEEMRGDELARAEVALAAALEPSGRRGRVGKAAAVKRAVKSAARAKKKR